MKQKHGEKATLVNPIVISAVIEGEQKSYIEALAASRKVTQSVVLRDMITYWADGHKI